MKQLEKDKLCYYCFSCTKLEQEQFEGVRNCKGFIPAVEGWEEKFKKELMNK